MNSKARIDRALAESPSWVAGVALGAAALIVVDVVLGLVGRGLSPLPEDPAWRRALWSGLAGTLTASVAVGLLSLAGCGVPAGARFRRWFGFLAILFALGLLAGGIGVVIDGSSVIASAPAERASLLWTSVTLDALRGLGGASFAVVVARILLSSGSPAPA